MRTKLLFVAAVFSLALTACGGNDEPGGPSPTHTLARARSASAPVVEARSERHAVKAAVGAPPAVAESAKYRLLHKGLRPAVKR